jgi:hypothetical protein
MARPKLDKEQRAILLGWLAADYDWRLIQSWFREREWPELTRNAIYHYRKRFSPVINELRDRRYSDAINSGLALKEERVARLKQHADELEKIKWLPDEKGRLWNEKSWRETLEDIAAEMGQRKQSIEHTGKDGGPIQFAPDLTSLSDEELELLERLLGKTSTATADNRASESGATAPPVSA